MQASVWAPVTTSRPTPRCVSSDSKIVSSKESPYFLWTSGSDSRRCRSETYCQPSLPCGISSFECCIQITGT